MDQSRPVRAIKKDLRAEEDARGRRDEAYKIGDEVFWWPMTLLNSSLCLSDGRYMPGRALRMTLHSVALNGMGHCIKNSPK